MTRPTQVRPPAPTDCQRIAELCGQLGYPSTREQVSHRLSLLQGPDQQVLAAYTPSGELVGWIQVGLVYRLECDPIAEIGGLVVDEQHRGQGIGSDLLAAAERWAEAAAIGAIRIRCNVTRERTHGFYLAAGYDQTKTSLLFRKQL